jgi:dTDP-4-amino-4,6-dideoxygalactose transaminase
MTAHSIGAYQHRLVIPDLPGPAEYLPLLEEMHENGWYSNFGPLVQRFENRLLEMLGVTDETCVSCCNATAGLSAALLATGRSGQVLLPAFTFPASLGAIRAAGLVPVVTDVDAESWTLHGDLLDRALVQSGATMVMLVAPFGIHRDLAADLTICRRRGAALIIDSAAGLGGPRSTEAAQEDVFEVFSMHATKPFAVGEGGAIFAHCTHDAALRSVLNFALTSSAKPQGPLWGFNGKMSEFHAAVGIAQLQRFRDRMHQRQASAAIYKERLSSYSEIVHPPDVSSAPWQVFPVLLPRATVAERFIELAGTVGVEIRRYYRPSLSRWPETPCVRPCPVAEDLSDRMCVLPIRAYTSDPAATHVIDLVIHALDKALTSR